MMWYLYEKCSRTVETIVLCAMVFYWLLSVVLEPDDSGE